MADGTWTDAVIDFNAQATAAAPITLKARTPGKVILTGTSRLTFSRPYLVADGLHFKNGIPAQGNVIDFKTDHCRLTNAAVVDYNPLVPTQDYYWVYFNGSHNRVDHSYFKGKNNNQPLVGNDQDDSRYNQVDYCHFKDIPHSNVNGREIFRIWGYGRSEELGDDGSFFTIEYNLFGGCHRHRRPAPDGQTRCRRRRDGCRARVSLVWMGRGAEKIQQQSHKQKPRSFSGAGLLFYGCGV